MKTTPSSPFLDAELLGGEPAAEQALPPPRPGPAQEVALAPHLKVVDAGGRAVSDGEYAFHQGDLQERGRLGQAGLAFFGPVDPNKPFRFEVRDRVCTIRAGAYIDPDDAALEYGGTLFDWTLVRDRRDPERSFWPHYQRAMDLAVAQESAATSQGRPLVRFAQHDHLTRRPMQRALPPGPVSICATPAQLRVGPFVRYADHGRAVIWLETVTPSLVRVRFRRSGSSSTTACGASAVRVGGRHFAVVEIGPLQEEEFHDYTVDLAPLPAVGAVPVTSSEVVAAFPPLTPAVAAALKQQCAAASLGGNEWMVFRTLRARYDRRLRFATGSCRWYPGDRKDGKDWGPDMLSGLGQWLRSKPRGEWPAFLFFGGDQIYADEIGDDHAEMLVRSRFASRVPGPADAAASLRDKLVDGAWAGRFAHRYQAYQVPPIARVEAQRRGQQHFDALRRRHPDLGAIDVDHPERDPVQALRRRYETYRNRRQLSGAHGEADDEKAAREALAQAPALKALEIGVEPFRAFLPHWEAGFGTALRSNPMQLRQLCHNFLLWQIPVFESQLPTLSQRQVAMGLRRDGQRGHRSAEGGHHAADFAEYAYLYELAWTSSRDVRVLLAQVPSFLMFDDHEATDDWNFSVPWVRMLHNRRDDWRMWPKTLTDSLAAYWMYQGWGNKPPSAWPAADPRIRALAEAQRQGRDALPALRRCIHGACFAAVPSSDPNKPFQTGLGLDWHYRLPFEPPFLVPDCRTRKRLVPADDDLRVIVQNKSAAKRPLSQTIDSAQLDWLREHLVARSVAAPVAFIAPSTPLLLQKKLMDFMMKPELAARAWAQGLDVASLGALLLGSTALGTGSNALLTAFRRSTDLEHMMRDRSWRDLWALFDAMRTQRSAVKTLVLVSGDVHHSYCMTARLPGGGRTQPEVLQITSSGLQTTRRGEAKTSLAEALSSREFGIDGIRLQPGYMARDGTAAPDLALFGNAVAIVDVAMGTEVRVVVTHLSGADRHVYRYDSGPGYGAADAPGVPAFRAPGQGFDALPTHETGTVPAD